VPEGMNVEIAHKLSEHEAARAHHERWHSLLEVVEVTVLAVVAVATAWSGRRFTTDYRAAFEAWLKTNPFTNEKAPAGPAYMPEYVNPKIDEATHLNAQASEAFQQGTEARETGEKYVRNTVLFASVLFLVALAQRQRSRGARVAANGIAVALLLFTMVSVVTLPRL
jgi:hypothetical protein